MFDIAIVVMDYMLFKNTSDKIELANCKYYREGFLVNKTVIKHKTNTAKINIEAQIDCLNNPKIV